MRRPAAAALGVSKEGMEGAPYFNIVDEDECGSVCWMCRPAVVRSAAAAGRGRRAEQGDACATAPTAKYTPVAELTARWIHGCVCVWYAQMTTVYTSFSAQVCGLVRIDLCLCGRE